MIETIIREYLTAKIPTIKTYIDVPAAPDATRIVIERTGGGMDEHIRSAMVAVQSIAPTMYEAATLHENVIGKMMDMIERNDVSSVQLNAEYNFTDTETKECRYQAVFDIVYF